MNVSKRRQRGDITRIELGCPLIVSLRLFPASLALLNATHRFKYPRVVRQGVASNFQFSQRAVIVLVTLIKMQRLAQVRLASIGTNAKRLSNSCLCQGQPRRGVVNLAKVEYVVREGQLAIRVEKRGIVRDRPVQKINRPTNFFHSVGWSKKNTVGARIQIERNEITRRPAFDR